MVAAAAATLSLFADSAYEFVTKDNGNGYGYSYIKINQDLDSFSFKSDWHSLGNAGKVGYVVYTSDMSDEQMAAYMEQSSHPPAPNSKRTSTTASLISVRSRPATASVSMKSVRTEASTR